MDKLTEILQIPEAVFVIKLFVVACIIILAVYLLLKLRDFAAGKMPRNGEYLTEFEKMRDEGLIDDKELSQVKSAVGKTADPVPERNVNDSYDD